MKSTQVFSLLIDCLLYSSVIFLLGCSSEPTQKATPDVAVVEEEVFDIDSALSGSSPTDQLEAIELLLELNEPLSLDRLAATIVLTEANYFKKSAEENQLQTRALELVQTEVDRDIAPICELIVGESSSERYRGLAISALVSAEWELDSVEVPGALEETLVAEVTQVSSAKLQADSLRLLAKIGGEQAFELAISALNREKPREIKLAALEVLSSWGEDAATAADAITPLVEDRSIDVTLFAISTLVTVSQEHAVELAAVVKFPYRPTAQEAAIAALERSEVLEAMKRLPKTQQQELIDPLVAVASEPYRTERYETIDERVAIRVRIIKLLYELGEETQAIVAALYTEIDQIRDEQIRADIKAATEQSLLPLQQADNTQSKVLPSSVRQPPTSSQWVAPPPASQKNSQYKNDNHWAEKSSVLKKTTSGVDIHIAKHPLLR